MKTFYNHIEKPIRPVVKLLRNSGFNTKASCGHEMWISIELDKTDDAYKIAECLRKAGYKNFLVEYEIVVMNTIQHNLKVTFQKRNFGGFEKIE